MINERQYIKEALYDWVAAVVAETGRTDPVIWDHERGPRPVPPFVSLAFVGGETPGMPNYNRVKNGVQYITRYVKRSLTMYAFGEGSFDLLETIKASIERADYMERLGNKQLVIPYALEVKENPVARGTEWEVGAMFDFYVTYNRVIEDTPGWIETVGMTGSTFKGEITIPMEVSDG